MKDIELYYLIDNEFNGLYNTIFVYNSEHKNLAIVELKSRWICVTPYNGKTKLTKDIEMNMNSFVSKDIHN